MIKKLNLLNVLLILLIFPLASFLMKDFLVYRYSGRKTEAVRAASPPPLKAPDIQDYASIVESPVFPSASRHLAGLSAADIEEASKKAPDASAALSELKLLGTFVGPDSFAIFEKKGEQEKPVKKGDRVFDAGILKDIQKGKVILLSGSREITISMPADSIIQGGPLNITDQPLQQIPLSLPSDRNVSKTGENEWVINQKAILNALNDIGQVLSDARLTPVMSKGEVEGFLVAEIKPSGIFDAIGLKNGDILKRVNGYEIVSPEKAVQVLSALKGETKIDLDIVRGGQKLNFHYDIR